MHKVAESSSTTLCLVKLSAPSLFEVGDRRKLAADGRSCVIAAVQSGHCTFCRLFIFILCINIADEMLSEIVTDVHVIQVTEFGEFPVDINVEFIKVLLHLLVGNNLSSRLCLDQRVSIHVWDQYSLTNRGLVVNSSAFFSMSTGTDFEVERTIDSAERGL